MWEVRNKDVDLGKQISLLSHVYLDAHKDSVTKVKNCGHSQNHGWWKVSVLL